MIKELEYSRGDVLQEARSRNQELPISGGEKYSNKLSEWMDSRITEAANLELMELLKEPTVNRKDLFAVGTWLPTNQMVRLDTVSGKFFQYMGVETDIGRCLYPEEALYLCTMGELTLLADGEPISSIKAIDLVTNNEFERHKYLVYAYFSNSGCRIVRHQVHLDFTLYEKQLRLDKHQEKKRHKNSQFPSKKTKNENIEDKLDEFYAVLGIGASIEDEEKAPEEHNEGKDLKDQIFDPLSDYERKKKELINMFPDYIDSYEEFVIQVPDRVLLPPDCYPNKDIYRISTDKLNFYSLYEDESQYAQSNYNNHNWRQNDCRNYYKGGNHDYNKGWNNGQNFNYNGRHMSHGNFNRNNDFYSRMPKWNENFRGNNHHHRNSYGNNEAKGTNPFFRNKQDRFSEDMNIDSYHNKKSDKNEHLRNMKQSYASKQEENWKKFQKNDFYPTYHQNLPKQNMDPCLENKTEENIEDTKVNITESKTQFTTDDIEKFIKAKREEKGFGSSNLTEDDIIRFIHSKRKDQEIEKAEQNPDDISNSQILNYSIFDIQNFLKEQRKVTDKYDPQFPSCDNLEETNSKDDDYLFEYPEWKTRRRKKQRVERFPSYPSCLVSAVVKQVRSWKEYKQVLATTSEKSLLKHSPAAELWRGKTVPLVKPSLAKSRDDVNKLCSIIKSVDLNKTTKPESENLAFHFDAYLHTNQYKKTCPSIPDYRISILKSPNVPTPGQLREASKRFKDEVLVICAMVVAGEVRLYSTSPLPSILCPL